MRFLCGNGFCENEYLRFVLGHFDHLENCDDDIEVEINKGEVFSVEKAGEKVTVKVTDKSQLFFALTLIKANASAPSFVYGKTTPYKTIDFMLDCSRSAVLSVEKVKELIVTLAKLGYNALELYTEDTYEIPSEPYFGHLRGRYSQKDLKELVAFAENYGVELIPCIQTLAHLDNIFLWPVYQEIHDVWDCLLIDDERSYALIDKMFLSIAECFTSRTVHIGYDEAYYAGRGKYLDKHGFVNKSELLRKHLKRVLEIALKYGFTCKIYADMFLHCGDFDSGTPLPENVVFVYWNYYNTDQRAYEKDLKKMRNVLQRVEFRAGDWKWLGNTPMNRYGIRRTAAGMKAAQKFRLNTVSLSAWGDNGNECSVFATMPQIVNFSMLSYFGKCDFGDLDRMTEASTGVNAEDFLKLDIANSFKVKNPKTSVNPAKYLLLNDPLCGIMDGHVNASYNEYYKKCAKLLKTTSKRAGKWKYLFDEQFALCDYLSVKANMGNDLYALYQAKDIAGLEHYAATTVKTALKKLDAFIVAYRTAWHTENKTFGFDVSELRLGGQKQRLVEIQTRIKELADGKIDRIEELEQPKLAYYEKTENGLIYIHNSKYIISPFFPVV